MNGKRYFAYTGLRPTNAQDIMDMSDEIYGIFTAMFDSIGDCILSGMVPTVGGAGLDEISSGTMILDGEVCYYPGETGLTFPVKIKQRITDTNLKLYADAGTKGTRKFYEAYVDATGTFDYTSAGGINLDVAIADFQPDATTTQKGTLETATSTETKAGSATDKIVTPFTLYSKVRNTDLILQIVNWDMYTGGSGTLSFSLAHGLSPGDLVKIRSIDVMIRFDSGAVIPLTFMDSAVSEVPAGGVTQIDNTYIYLKIKSGSSFDSSSFQTVAGFVRGFCTIRWDENY